MKKLLSIILSICLLVSILTLFLATVSAAGVGSVENDYSLDPNALPISTIYDFMWMENGASYYLTNDLDFSNYSTSSALVGITDFNGTVDGCGYVIRGINVSASGDIGVFESGFSGTLKNITFGTKYQPITITTSDSGASVSAISPSLGNATFENVKIYASLSGQNKTAAFGANLGSSTVTIDACEVNGSIKGDAASGFLVSDSYANETTVTITNSANYANISSTGGLSVAGFYARHTEGDAERIRHLTVKGCANSGKISGNDWRAGGIVGEFSANAGSTLLIDRCYNVGDVSMGNEGGYAAGIVGGMSFSNDPSTTRTVQNCYNVGKITHNSREERAMDIAYSDRTVNIEIKNCIGFMEKQVGGGYDTYAALATSNLRVAEDASEFLPFLTASSASEVGFIKDSANINKGFPVLSWQFSTPAFSQGTISSSDGVYTIGSQNFSAFISTRKTQSDDTIDLRVVLAASKTELDKYSALDMTLEFKDETGRVIKSFTRGIGSKEFPVYLTASAAGITYSTADNAYLFGLVVTGIPHIAWDTVTASISEPDSEPFFQGSVNIEQAVPEYSPANRLTYYDMALNTYESYMNTFYSMDFWNSYNTLYKGWFWDVAETIEAFLDGYEATGEKAILDTAIRVSEKLENRWGTYWRSNSFNDDIAWAVIAYTRLYNLTGDSRYLTIARDNFDMMYNRSYSDDLGGGLWWTTDNETKNACINCPASIAACLLAEATADDSYYVIAEDLMNWVFDTLLGENGNVYDSLHMTNGYNYWASSYNQGTFIGACNLLYQHTENTLYYNNAMKAANYAMNDLSIGGVFDNGEGGSNSGDLRGFKGILTRWLYRFGRDNKLPEILTYLRRNATVAYSNRNSQGLIWSDWRTKTPSSHDHNFFSFSTSLALMFNCQSYRDTIPTPPTSVLDTFIKETSPVSMGPIHEGVWYTYRTDTPTVGYWFRFGYRSETGLWSKDEVLGKEGLQLTTPNCIYIRNVTKGELDYTRYEIANYYAPDWWQYFFLVDGFTPVFGDTYELALFLNTNDNPVHNHPNSVTYWQTTEPWVFNHYN